MLISSHNSNYAFTHHAYTCTLPYFTEYDVITTVKQLFLTHMAFKSTESQKDPVYVNHIATNPIKTYTSRHQLWR